MVLVEACRTCIYDRPTTNGAAREVDCRVMSLRPIYGQESLLDRLAGALASSRFPQAVLFTGPIGVGKQRLALWVAQGLLCEHGPGAPCGSCSHCRQVLGLGHPDLHWFVPIPRPKAGDPAKQAEEAQEYLGEVMAERRRQPLWGRPEGLTSHSLASVRLFHRLAWMTPFSGPRKVFVLGDAERLIVQESSPEAANALLKVLEEPPADTTIIVTAADPHALLPTIRSRLVAIRIPRLKDDDIRAFLKAEVQPAPKGAALERRVVLAEGCVGRALKGDDGSEAPDRAAATLLTAVRERDRSWLPMALAQPTWAARGEFTGMLDALAVTLRDEVRQAAGSEGKDVEGRLRAIRRVQEAREAAQGNANPQLALAVLAADLEALL